MKTWIAPVDAPVGRGEKGCRPFTLDGQDTSRHFEGILGPYVQYCPCEASDQKPGQKPESELKVIELSYCHHSIFL